VGVLALLEAEHRAAVADVMRGGPEWLREHSLLGASGWASAIASSSCCVLVAGLDGVPLGFGLMRMLDDTATGVIPAIYIHPGARELGLGDGLVAELLAAARTAGMRAVESTALPGDRDTKNLFERAGLVARLIVVSKRLD
jgi:GNAT superfamily N-acetyltransferase